MRRIVIVNVQPRRRWICRRLGGEMAADWPPDIITAKIELHCARVSWWHGRSCRGIPSRRCWPYFVGCVCCRRGARRRGVGTDRRSGAARVGWPFASICTFCWSLVMRDCGWWRCCWATSPWREMLRWTIWNTSSTTAATVSWCSKVRSCWFACDGGAIRLCDFPRYVGQYHITAWIRCLTRVRRAREQDTHNWINDLITFHPNTRRMSIWTIFFKYIPGIHPLSTSYLRPWLTYLCFGRDMSQIQHPLPVIHWVLLLS